MTPIDWKPVEDLGYLLTGYHRHHSLVTPIDWKPHPGSPFEAESFSHYLLVTPIDWKLGNETFRLRPRVLSPLVGEID